MEEMQELIQILKDSNNIVFFGGAGVSTESNIPDFRSSNGLWNEKYYKQEDLKEERSYQHRPQKCGLFPFLGILLLLIISEEFLL